MYELYPQCLGHPGEQAMKTIHHHIDDIPPLKGNSAEIIQHVKCDLNYFMKGGGANNYQYR
jgi:hypothetical protein